MGLDMYLKAKKYMSPYFDEADGERIEQINEMLFPKHLTNKADKFDRGITVNEVTAEVAYWRKANAIHGWFVDNCQDGIDECQETLVGRANLQKLLDTVTKVLENHELAAELLPPHQGFFFGSDKVDQYYIQDLQFTKDRLELLLNDPTFKTWDFYYQSSW
jgi:hypothetical protein